MKIENENVAILLSRNLFPVFFFFVENTRKNEGKEEKEVGNHQDIEQRAKSQECLAFLRKIRKNINWTKKTLR